MQAHVRVCEENIEKTIVNNAYWNNFVVKNVSWEAYQDDILKDDSP